MVFAELLCWKVGQRTALTSQMNCTVSMFWRVTKTRFDDSDNGFCLQCVNASVYTVEVFQLPSDVFHTLGIR